MSDRQERPAYLLRGTGHRDVGSGDKDLPLENEAGKGRNRAGVGSWYTPAEATEPASTLEQPGVSSRDRRV